MNNLAQLFLDIDHDLATCIDLCDIPKVYQHVDTKLLYDTLDLHPSIIKVVITHDSVIDVDEYEFKCGEDIMLARVFLDAMPTDDLSSLTGLWDKSIPKPLWVL